MKGFNPFYATGLILNTLETSDKDRLHEMG